MLFSNIKTWLSNSRVKPGDILFIHGDLIVAAQFSTQDQNNVFKCNIMDLVK